MKLKICGMQQAANIAAVAELMPDYLGFIFYRKSPRYITEISAELIKYLPLPIKSTGVFVDEDLDRVKKYLVKYNLKAVQLHGKESPGFCEQIKATGIEVIKAFGIDEHFDFSVLPAYEKHVDYFLFDTKTKDHGGSGKVFDWELLSNYDLTKPYFLSGGIDLAYLQEIKAIADERLFALDVNSKFEIEPGLKDIDKLKELINGLR